MEKLRNYLEKWTNGEKVKGFSMTPYDIWECIDVYNAIIRKEKPSFLNAKVKEVLEKCGIKTVSTTIGWKVC